VTICIIEAKLWTAFFSDYQDIVSLMGLKDLFSGLSAIYVLGGKYRGLPSTTKVGHLRVPAKLIWGSKIWSYLQYLKIGVCPGPQQNLFGEAKYRGVSTIKKMGYF